MTGALLGDPPAFLDWSDAFVLKHAVIDSEHIELFGLVNRLAATIAETKRWEAAVELADQLVDATHRHFDHEEAMMRAAQYPALDRHHEQHTELLSQIETLRDRLAADHYLARPRQTMLFLSDWFSLHVARSDRSFVDFLKAKS